MKCYKCKKHTPLDSFATFRTRAGVIRRRGICKGCRNQYGIENFDRLKKYRKEYYSNPIIRTKKRESDRQRRLEIKKIIDDLKEKSRCFDCGGKFEAVCMDFDHCHGKNKSISSMVSGAYKIDLILEEIKFCEIVCSNCHRIRTRDRRQNTGIKK